jgi:hypothetical protein
MRRPSSPTSLPALSSLSFAGHRVRAGESPFQRAACPHSRRPHRPPRAHCRRPLLSAVSATAGASTLPWVAAVACAERPPPLRSPRRAANHPLVCLAVAVAATSWCRRCPLPPPSPPHPLVAPCPHRLRRYPYLRWRRRWTVYAVAAACAAAPSPCRRRPQTAVVDPPRSPPLRPPPGS